MARTMTTPHKLQLHRPQLTAVHQLRQRQPGKPITGIVPSTAELHSITLRGQLNRQGWHSTAYI